MSQPYIGEIKMFGGNFAPRNYALCNGQLLSIAQNTALFSIFGTTFGGDGRSTFALPNLQSMAPLGVGDGPGLTPRVLGEQVGSPAVTLLASELPSHSHNPTALSTSPNPAPVLSPAGSVWAVAGARRATPICTKRRPPAPPPT